MWPVGRRRRWEWALGAALAVTWAAGALPGAAAAAAAVPVQTLLAPGTLDTPASLTLDHAGDVFVADTGHCRVLEIPARSGHDYGVALRRGRPVAVAGGRCGHGRIGHPSGLAVDTTGDVYIAEANDQRVQVLEPSGAIANVAGTGVAGAGGNGGVAASAQLHEPTAVAVDRNGDLFIADTANCEVRVVAEADGQILGQPVERDHIYAVAGTGVCGTTGQGGPMGSAQLFDPVALAVDFAGDLLVADQGDQSVLLATQQGGTFYGTAVGAGDIGVVVGGTGSYGPYVADGLSATSAGAELNDPRGITLGPTGSLVISDGFMHVVRIVPAQTGTQFGRPMTANDLYTVAGALPVQTTAGSGDATRWVLTKMGTPTGVALTAGGALLYCDALTGAVVRIG